MEKLNKYLVLFLIAICSAYTIDGFAHNSGDMEVEVKISQTQGTPDLGVVVENTADNKGVRVVSISDDSPAERQDIAVGDVIIAIGEAQVTNITDYESALSSQGLTPYVVVNRGGEKIYKKVILEKAEVTIEKKTTKVVKPTPAAVKKQTIDRRKVIKKAPTKMK